MRFLSRFKTTVFGYLADFTSVQTAELEADRAVITQQVKATTEHIIRIVWLAICVGVAAPFLIGSVLAAQKFVGAGAIVLVNAAGWVVLRQHRDDPARSAQQHLWLALCLGLSWGYATMTLTIGETESVVALIACVQVALLCVGLMLYTNMPAAFIRFSLPIAVSLMITAARMAPDYDLVMIGLIAIFFVMLSRSVVDQARLFSMSVRASYQLLEIEASRHDIEQREADARLKAQSEYLEIERLRADRDRAAEADRRQAALQLAATFETGVVATMNALAGAIQRLEGKAKQIADVVTGAVAGAHETALSNAAVEDAVGKLAGAATRLTTSIAAIAVDVGDHASLSERVAQAALESRSRIADSTSHTSQINSVVEVIRQVAAQTNLLALNATIEAVRAGDAGAGFSVVANEVKTLAKRSSEASELVQQRIATVLDQLGLAIDGLSTTSDGLSSVSHIGHAVAAAVDRQRRDTAEIGVESTVIGGQISTVRALMSTVIEGAEGAERLMIGIGEEAADAVAHADDLRLRARAFLKELRAA